MELENGAIDEVVATEDVSTDDVVDEGSAVTEPDKSDDETDVSEFGENETISKKAFLARLNKSKEKRTAAETRAAQLEQQLQEQAYLKNLEALITSDPEIERGVIDLLTKEKKQAEVDPVLQKVEEKLNQYQQKQQKAILKTYTDEFNDIVKNDMKTQKQAVWTKSMVQIELDNNFPGWREHHIPGLVEKVYKSVRDEWGKVFNGQKMDYIKNKISDTEPDIGKGTKGTKVDRVPIENDEDFHNWVASMMTNT